MEILEASVEPPTEESHIVLLGRPPLEEFFGFMKLKAARPENVNERRLAEEWRLANDHVVRLRAEEADIADAPQIFELPGPWAELSRRVEASKPFQRGFAAVPAVIGMIDLDRIVVFQKSINLAHVKRIQERLGDAPSAERVFETCFPNEENTLPLRASRASGSTFIFTSPSNDFRFMEAALLSTGDLAGYRGYGPAGPVIGLVLGFGINCVSAVSAENRLILMNGSHRAFALREMGVRYLPCAVVKVSRRAELPLVCPKEVHQNPDRYLRHPRPPMLKDYFDPCLRKIVAVPVQNRQIRVSFRIESMDV